MLKLIAGSAPLQWRIFVDRTIHERHGVARSQQ
jgi:hypothetical protein